MYLTQHSMYHSMQVHYLYLSYFVIKQSRMQLPLSPESSMVDAGRVSTARADVSSVLYHSCTPARITIWLRSLLRPCFLIWLNGILYLFDIGNFSPVSIYGVPLLIFSSVFTISLARF